ncbi:MAG: zinc metalloprotease [Nocardioidaceae bacterium]
MRRSTSLASAIGIAVLAFVVSDHVLPTARLARPQAPQSGEAAQACVEMPVIARGTDIVDPDHLGDAEVVAADQRLIRAEAEQRAVSRKGPARPGLDTRRRQPTVVRVFVHVLRDATSGGVARARIERQIAVMNLAYAGGQSARGSYVPLVFRLARVDVTANAGWFRMEEGSVAEKHAKRTLHRGDASDLNVYVTGSRSGLLGWATQPTAYRQAPMLDGITISRRALPGGMAGPYSSGDVAVHESGHWLGLFHTFTGRCGTRGDLVGDTPRESRPSYTCPRTRDTCAAPGRDPIHNFMDYSYDRCMNRFTAGQAARMTRAWSALRAVPGA